MKCQRIRGEIEGVGNGAGRHAVAAGLDQKAEYVEAVILREPGQGRQRIGLFNKY